MAPFLLVRGVLSSVLALVVLEPMCPFVKIRELLYLIYGLLLLCMAVVECFKTTLSPDYLITPPGELCVGVFMWHFVQLI